MPAVAVGAGVTGTFLIRLLPAPHRQPLSKVHKGHVRRRQARPQALPWAAASMGRMCGPQSPQPGRGRPVPAGVRRPACVSEHALRALPVRVDPVLQRGGRTRRRCVSSVNRWTRGRGRSSEGERDAGVGTRQGRCARGPPRRGPAGAASRGPSPDGHESCRRSGFSRGPSAWSLHGESPAAPCRVEAQRLAGQWGCWGAVGGLRGVWRPWLSRGVGRSEAGVSLGAGGTALQLTSTLGLMAGVRLTLSLTVALVCRALL